jgi:hypothetical protein
MPARSEQSETTANASACWSRATNRRHLAEAQGQKDRARPRHPGRMFAACLPRHPLLLRSTRTIHEQGLKISGESHVAERGYHTVPKTLSVPQATARSFGGRFVGENG